MRVARHPAETASAPARAAERRRRLDLGLLAVLVALDDTRSVSAAALAMGVSQPQVSVALGKLRELFNDAMFVRTTRGMQPTPRAAALVKSARGVLAQIDREIFGEDSFAAATDTRPFILALSDAGEAVILPHMLRLLRESAPNAPIRSVSLPVGEVAQGLESGDIDLAVGYLPDLCKRNLFHQTLFTDGYVSLVREEHPVRTARFDIKQFLQYEHAVVRAPLRHQELIDCHLARRRIRPRIGFACPHAVTLPGIVGQSDMIATVARRLADHFLAQGAPLRRVELPFPLPNVEIRQYWHSKVHHDARSRWLRVLIASAFHDQTAAPPQECARPQARVCASSAGGVAVKSQS